MHPVRAIILKLVGSEQSPFLCTGLTTDSPQEGGGLPVSKTFEKSVANVWLQLCSFERTPNEIPSGPGADCLFDLDRMVLTSLGLMGLLSKGLNPGLSGDVGRSGNQ